MDESTDLHRSTMGQDEVDDDETINLGANWANAGMPSRAKTFRIHTSNHAAAPVDGAIGATPAPTEPDIVTGLHLPGTRIETRGVMFMFKAPTDATVAVAIAAGFTVTPWVRDPGTREWADSASVSVPFNRWIVSNDFNGGELFFQIAAASVVTPGAINVRIREVTT